MDNANPVLVDKLGYASAGILMIIGLAVALWSLHHMLAVGVISWMGVVFGYILIAGMFGFFYGDLWVADEMGEK